MLLRSLVGSLATACLVCLAAPVSASAAAPEERVLRDDVALTVGTDGVVHAKETIVYDFAGSKAIDRSFVTKIREDDTHDRVYKIENVKASSPDGGPATAQVRNDGDRTTVRLSGGQAGGRRTIALQYDIRGAVARLGGAEELRWIAVGGWRVPVVSAKASIQAGGAGMRNINCFAGALGSSIGCTQATANHAQTRGDFSQQNMLPQEYMTVVAGYPAGVIKAQPLYEKRHTVATAFTVNATTGGVLVGLLVLLLGGFAVLYQLRGRDARVVGRKAAEGDHTPVNGMSFEPPSGVRPGQIGTLIDEQADVIDVTATIVDLAVRGYLLVEEDDRDWTLRRLQRPVDDLFPYERTLFDALFADRDAVRLAELGGTFAADLAEVRSALYDDVVKQGWFARRPDTVRTRWTSAGMVLAAVGVVSTILLALFTELALVGLALIIAGAALALGGQYMPAKTGRGSTVLAHTIGFRAYLTRGEASDVESRQRIAMFSRYLPYAIVFDNVHKWAKTVEDAGVKSEGADNLYWYEGPAEWDLSRFADSMRNFTLATSGAISQTRQFRGLS